MKDTASKMSLDLDHLLFQDVHSCCQNTIYEATVSIKHIQTNLLLAFISDIIQFIRDHQSTVQRR